MSTAAATATRAVSWRRAWASRGRWPLVTLAGALLAVALVLLPLTFLVVQAQQNGWDEVQRLVFRHSVAVLLWNTVRLAVACTLLCAVLGVAAAWCVERTDVPARHLLAVLLVLPLGIPDFVVGFGWVSIDPGLRGYLAAVMIMTLSLYPLVYLPVASAMRNLDEGLEEAARSLGLGPWRTFMRVTLRQVRPAVLGGCLLVTLALLAEYGAFEIVEYRTFTVAIFTQFKLGFDTAAACSLSLVLVVLSIAALAGELALSGPSGTRRSGPGARRPPRRVSLGRAGLPALAGLCALVALALGVPGGSIGYWLAHGGSSTLPGTSIASAIAHTALYSAAAAALATVLAIPVVMLCTRHRTRFTVLLERLAYLPMALPGIVVALGLVSFTIHHAFSLYQSSSELIAAYAILFLPLALVGVRSSIGAAPARLEELARSLGAGPATVWRRVTLPLIAPGLAVAFALVFISAATELTATLVLRPTGVNTLATRFWAYTSELSYGSAAPYAALMVAVSAVPAYLLSRRLTRAAGTGSR